MFNMLNIPLAVVGLLGIATALPHAPEAQLVAKSVIPDDILQAMAVDRSTFPSFQTGGLIRSNATVDPTLATRDGLEKRCTNGVSAVGGCCAAGAAYTTGDIDNGGWGVLITNGNTAEWAGFYFYENDCDSVPLRYTWVAPGDTYYIALPNNFQGRMSRGDDQMNLIGQPNLLGSWFEFNRDQTNGGVWADVSLIRGCDGAMFIRATDGSNAWAGFLQDIISGAPGGAFASKPDGARVLSPTEDGNTVTLNYELSTNIEGTTYIDDSHGSPVIFTSNGRIAVYAVAGII